MNEQLEQIFVKYFQYLVDEFEYKIDSSRYDSKSFGNFIIELSKGSKKIKILSDRSQIFIDIFTPDTGWSDKEKLLEQNGIPRGRFGLTKTGLWIGYEIENQSRDLY